MAHRVLPAVAVSALVAWSFFAFGAVYPWASLPVVAGAGLLALARRPRFGGSPALGTLDVSLLLLLAAALAQLVPMPEAALVRLSPHVLTFEAAYRVDSGLASAPGAHGSRPLSLAPASTVEVLLLVAAMMLIFWTSRTIFATGGGTRRVARAVSWMGLLAAIAAIVQKALSPGLIYGFWRPLEPGAQPLGPIVNRSHFATWMLMAAPISVGCLVAHVQTRRAHSQPLAGIGWLVRTIDTRAVWLAVSGVLMVLALVLSTSRAALVGLGVCAAFGIWTGRQRTDPAGRWVLTGFAVLALSTLLVWANLGALATRLDELLVAGPGGRALVWGDTLAIIKDFWLTGVGLGSFQTAMVEYQTSLRQVFFNHAHNQYLQLAAEGGLLLSLPAALAVVAFMRAAAERLARDDSPRRSLRAGALSGLIAVAVQSLWDCGLNTPANGVLLAVAAGLVLHQTAPSEYSHPRSAPLRSETRPIN